MAVDVDRILELLDQGHINREVLLAHDEARESFNLPNVVAEDFLDFKTILTSYVQHHHRTVSDSRRTDQEAFGEAKRILENEYRDQYRNGWDVALQMGQSGSQGGMREILNKISDALKSRALQDYMDHVYHQHVDTLSKDQQVALSKAFYERFGPILSRFNIEVDEHTFARDTRAALDYHRQVIEQIKGIAKKI